MPERTRSMELDKWILRLDYAHKSSEELTLENKDCGELLGLIIDAREGKLK